jgi:starch phosphorylase
MEFGLHDSLPLYAGGLGILAGDYLKTASDLDVPVFGIGILWQQGYFRQVLDGRGTQTELYPYNEPASLPLQPVVNPRGERLRIRLIFPGRTILLRAWQVTVGRTVLYLLDSNDPFNAPADRGLTSALYGGNSEVRLLQEVILGVGGWRLVQALGLGIDICHLNEGHAAFAVVERARHFREQHGTTFREGWATRAGNVTTHTAVPAGFDTYPATETETPAVLRRVRAGPGVVVARVAGVGTSESRRCGRTVQHGMAGRARVLVGERRQRAARRGEPPAVRRVVSALARAGDPGCARHQWRARAVLGFAVDRRALDPRGRQGAMAW